MEKKVTLIVHSEVEDDSFEETSGKFFGIILAGLTIMSLSCIVVGGIIKAFGGG